MSAAPTTAERTFLTFLGIGQLVLCGYFCLFTIAYVVLMPVVLVSGLSTVALLCRAVDSPVWSPALWLGTLPAGMLLLGYAVL